MPHFHDDWDGWYETNDAEERAFPLRGLPNKTGNIATEGSPFDPVQLRAALDNARSLQRSITGEETSGVIAAPSGGHVHEEGWDAAMPWCQVAEWQLTTFDAGGVDANTPSKPGLIVGDTSFVDTLFVPFVLPIGQTRVVPVFFVKISNSNTLTIKFDFYDPDDLNTIINGGEVSIGPTSMETGVVSDPVGYDLSGIDLEFSHRVVFMRVQTKVSSSTAILKQVVLRIPDRGYRTKGERTELDTTYLESDIVPSADKLYQIFVENPANLRKSIFGTEVSLPSRSYAHDHGERRGLPLKRHQFSISYGPYNFADGGAVAGGSIGIPIPYPTSGSFVTTPKLLAHNLIQLNGQIGSLSVFVAGYMVGAVNPRLVNLTLELRPIGSNYLTPGENGAITTTVELTRSGSGFAVGVGSFGSVLLDLGAVGNDRVYELNVWLEEDLASSEEYRLTGLCAIPEYVGSYIPANYFTDDLSQPALEKIPTVRIRESQETSNLLTAQFATVSNQLTREALGGTPGYKRNAFVNTSRKWKHNLREVHQHRGTFTDPITGDIIDDGAVIRRMLFSQTYARRFQRSALSETTYSMNNDPPLGAVIHDTTMTVGEQWLIFENVVSIPQGLGGIDLYATLNVSEETDSQARLFCFVELFDEGSSAANRANFLSCAGVEGTDNITGKSGLEVFGEVFPFDASNFATNRSRLSKGLGLWTADALRETSKIGDTQIYRHAYRTTQPIKIDITPTYSGAHRLRVRWLCQTGTRATFISAGTYSSNIRLLSMMAVPSRGF